MPTANAIAAVEKANSIGILCQSVTFEKGPMGWVATGWQKGLPVARKPVSDAFLVATLQRFPVGHIFMTF